MADDTREQSTQSAAATTSSEEPRPYRRPKPKHDFPQSQAGKLWEAFGKPDNPVNELPGGMVNTAGGKPREVTWRDAFKFDQFMKDGPKWYQTGCARDAMLVGIGSGGAVGGLHFILRGLSSMMITTNLAVVTFTISAGGMHYWCTKRQREEAQGMAAAVAGMKMLHEKRARERAAEEAAAAAAATQAAAKLKEEQEKLKNKSWKFW